MSNDTVDDLHAAEDYAGSLAAALEELLALTRDVAIDAAVTAGLDLDRYRATRARGVALVDGWGDYCRPTCGAEGDPDSGECTDDTCGCPCGHRDGSEGTELSPTTGKDSR